MYNKYLLFLIISLVACNAQDNSYEISIRCSECTSTQVTLYSYNGLGIEPISKTNLEWGKAEFSGVVKEPYLMYLFVDGSTDYVPMFVENGEIDVDYVWNKPSRSVVKGLQCQKIFSDFLRSFSVYADKSAGIEKMIENAVDNDDTIMIANLNANLEQLQNEIIEFQTRYIIQNIDSPVSAYILCSNLMYHLNSNQLDSLISIFPSSLKNHLYIKCASNYLKEISEN